MEAPQGSNKRKISSSLCLILSIAIVILLVSIVLVKSNRTYLREQALIEAEEKAELILDRNLAIHTYFTHKLKPAVFLLSDPYRPEDYFEPSWMSSTFAIHEINKYSQSLGTEGYYYKECAINARNPENEADDFEKAFLQELNSNPQLKKRSLIRKLDGQYFFVVLKKGEVMEESCFRCHSIPENAPKGLIDVYGPERSFGRSPGDVVSAISIRIPLSKAYANADELSKHTSIILALSLCVIMLFQFLLFSFFVGNPLKQIRKKAIKISKYNEHLGEEVQVPFTKDLGELAHAFNSMSKKLRYHADNLKQLVDDRTSELKAANNQLRKALEEIKTLRGIIPICSYCKKVRNDQGFWSQVEEYVHKHTHADFTHGICPDCYKKQLEEIEKIK